MDILNIITIILIIIAIAFIVYNIVLYTKYRRIINKSEHFGTTDKTKTCVLLKTHVWNDSLEKFAKKILAETKPYHIDFFILMHAEKDTEYDKIRNNNLKKITIKFKEAEIKSMYEKGFFSMWLCNHWILMWFYKNRGQDYSYIWTVEYDVRISGDSSKIWRYAGKEDFVYPIPAFHDPNWGWKDHYTGTKFTDETKWYGYLQLTRYSKNFLDYLHQNFLVGENGQDELIIFSLYKEGGFTGTEKFLNPLINNSWSVMNTDSDKHKKLLDTSETKYKKDKNHLQIFHPIK